MSSGSGDSTGNEKQKRISRHQTPSPPPRMSVAADKPSTEPSPSQPCIDSSERCEDKPPTKRSSSFADRPQSPSASKSQVQRQNSDRAFRSSMEAERRNLVNSKPTQMGVTPEKPRQTLSAEHRPSMSGKQAEHATAQSIGIVSFKEVPRVQSAVLESSPQMERKQRQMDVERKSGHSIVEKNMQKKPSGSPEPRGPQTPKVLRRTPKLEDLSLEASSSSQKTPRTSDKSTLWFEYGEV